MLQALPGQAEREGVELGLCQRHRCRASGQLTRPDEAALVQAARRAPDPKSVVHQQLDSGGPSVGELVAVMRLRATEDLHHACEQSASAGPHVHRLDGEPQCVYSYQRRADHRNNSRNHPAHSLVADIGQLTVEILKNTARMPMPPELLVGIETADDAAVYRLTDEIALIATTDFFMAIVDDPFDFGRIAAANAISDVYAMGGKPIMALALVGMPINVLSTKQRRLLEQGVRTMNAGR